METVLTDNVANNKIIKLETEEFPGYKYACLDRAINLADSNKINDSVFLERTQNGTKGTWEAFYLKIDQKVQSLFTNIILANNSQLLINYVRALTALREINLTIEEVNEMYNNILKVLDSDFIIEQGQNISNASYIEA